MIIRCVVEGCTWETSSDLPETVTDGTLAEIFGWGTVRATHEAQARQRAEVDTRRHLESHDVLDFIKTITGLRQALAAQVNMVLELTGQYQRDVFGLALDPEIVRPKT
jgi:hypothetical protein